VSSERTRRYGEGSDPARDATLDLRELQRPPSGLVAGDSFGRYRILSMIGRGGMGTVYAAHDSKLDRKIALKVLHDEHLSDGARQLVQEAQALARLADPHVVTVYDAGDVDGRVYLAMQLVDGITLGEAIEGAPSVAQILRWFVAAGRGLEAAHAVGLVHRDFKPSNVLIDRAGRVAVTDFGLAHDVVAQDRSLAGTPAYMSPEQHAAQVITPASVRARIDVAVRGRIRDLRCAAHPAAEANPRVEAGHRRAGARVVAIADDALAVDDRADRRSRTSDARAGVADCRGDDGCGRGCDRWRGVVRARRSRGRGIAVCEHDRGSRRRGVESVSCEGSGRSLRGLGQAVRAHGRGGGEDRARPLRVGLAGRCARVLFRARGPVTAK